MKFTLLTLILIVFASNSLIGQDLNCQKFRNGKFKILKDSIANETVLIRNGNLQTETLKGKEGSLEFIVNWIDDCTYTLTPTKKTFEIYGNLPKNAMLTVKITKTNENSYIQKSTSNFADLEYIAEIIKIE